LVNSSEIQFENFHLLVSRSGMFKRLDKNQEDGELSS